MHESPNTRQTTTPRNLPRPFPHRSAFFHGQIEQASRGMGSWLPRPDIPVLVTINATGVSVIDPKKSVSGASRSWFASYLENFEGLIFSGEAKWIGKTRSFPPLSLPGAIDACVKEEKEACDWLAVGGKGGKNARDWRDLSRRRRSLCQEPAVFI